MSQPADKCSVSPMVSLDRKVTSSEKGRILGSSHHPLSYKLDLKVHFEDNQLDSRMVIKFSGLWKQTLTDWVSWEAPVRPHMAVRDAADSRHRRQQICSRAVWSSWEKKNFQSSRLRNYSVWFSQGTVTPTLLATEKLYLQSVEMK